ncbi:MAG: hypothetical protein AAF731_04825 [Bacteroidota bacterium]
MDQAEINKELETLANEFKSSVSSHFKSKSILVELKSLEFSITPELNNLDIKMKSGDINGAESVENIIISECKVNDQGQVVCRKSSSW